MKNAPLFDYAAFEIKYGSGHLYLDRCGQCILDIERERPDWALTHVDIQAGQMENPGKWLHLNFNNRSFSFTAQKAWKLDLGDIGKEISALWRIIQANLALEDLSRVGFRLNYLLPTGSLDESEQRLRRSEINVALPRSLEDKGLSLKNRQVIIVLVREDMEYRVELGGVTRHEGLAPSEVLRTDPRHLSKRQNEFRVAKFKQMAEYSANPMYAVALNVDCFTFNPKTLSVEEFVLKHADVVRKEFLPVLERL